MAEIRPSKPSGSIPTASNGSTGGSQVQDMNNSPNYPYQSYQPIFDFENQEDQDLGPGLYAIQSNPYMNMLPAGYSPNVFIPLKFQIPTRENGEGQQGREREGGVRNQNQVVVRRFEFQFQLDLALLIKLAAVVFLFSQDGSTHRLFLLILSALFVYLYQTGTLTPIVRWFRQAARPAPRAQANNNDANNQRPEGNPEVVENPNPNPNPNQEGENQVQPAANNPNGNRVWGIIKEIQVIVVGFIMSLLPGFQHRD